jgi:Domain of unknown function (DUF4157)
MRTQLQKSQQVVENSPSKAIEQKVNSSADFISSETVRYKAFGSRTDHNFGMIRMRPREGLRVQAKLLVNKPGDSFEREADMIADQIMEMKNHPIAETTAHLPAAGLVLRKCAACGKEEEDKDEPGEGISQKHTCAKCDNEEKLKLQRKSSNSASPEISTSVLDVLKTPGQPLDADIRSFMEPRFGFDFSQVRIHNNTLAHQSAKDIHALAYTHQNHIIFGSDQYQPQTKSGRKLLAHELTHTIQQNLSGPSFGTNIGFSTLDNNHEGNANAVTERLSNDGSLDLGGQNINSIQALRVQRTPDPNESSTKWGSLSSNDNDTPRVQSRLIYNEKSLPNGRIQLRAYGTVGDKIQRSGLESKYPLPKDVSLPGYDRWHLVGPDAFGAEAGIAYTPKIFNISKTANIENIVRKAREFARVNGGDVEFDFTAECSVTNVGGVEIRILEKVTWKVDSRLAGSDTTVSLVNETASPEKISLNPKANENVVPSLKQANNDEIPGLKPVDENVIPSLKPANDNAKPPTQSDSSGKITSKAGTFAEPIVKPTAPMTAVVNPQDKSELNGVTPDQPVAPTPTTLSDAAKMNQPSKPKLSGATKPIDATTINHQSLPEVVEKLKTPSEIVAEAEAKTDALNMAGNMAVALEATRAGLQDISDENARDEAETWLVRNRSLIYQQLFNSPGMSMIVDFLFEGSRGGTLRFNGAITTLVADRAEITKQPMGIGPSGTGVRLFFPAVRRKPKVNQDGKPKAKVELNEKKSMIDSAELLISKIPNNANYINVFASLKEAIPNQGVMDSYQLTIAVDPILVSGNAYRQVLSIYKMKAGEKLSGQLNQLEDYIAQSDKNLKAAFNAHTNFASKWWFSKRIGLLDPHVLDEPHSHLAAAKGAIQREDFINAAASLKAGRDLVDMAEERLHQFWTGIDRNEEEEL